MFTAAVITVSDRSFRGERPDLGGPAVAEALEKAGYTVTHREIVPDEQPLIENAVYHGLAPRGTKGTVRISVRLQEVFLVLEISDDGCGMDEGNLRQGIGLTNVRRRIELYYKEKGTMEIHSQPGTGTCVRLSLPVNV